jgi:hypothetical protein
MRRATLIGSVWAIFLVSAALPAVSSASPLKAAPLSSASPLKVKPLWTHAAAISTAYKYAKSHFSYVVEEETRTSCSETGVNEYGKTQWVCYGPLYSESCYREWQVNIGPGGTVLYANGKVYYICS